MVEYKDVESFADEVKEIEVGKSTTFVRTNIRRTIVMIEGEKELEDGTLEKEMIERKGWLYDEKQYRNDEYINYITEQLKNVTNDKNELRSQVDVMSKIIDFFATILPVPTNE